jgi:hypothetical protein
MSISFRIVSSHQVQLRGPRRLWAILRGRPTSYTVIDEVEPLDLEAWQAEWMDHALYGVSFRWSDGSRIDPRHVHPAP